MIQFFDGDGMDGPVICEFRYRLGNPVGPVGRDLSPSNRHYKWGAAPADKPLKTRAEIKVEIANCVEKY